MTKRLRITINGEPYEVTAEILDDEGTASHPVSSSHVLPPVIAAAVPHLPPVPGGGSGVVTSPMSGKLVDYSVKAGDHVAVGDVLAVVEAMKMNTYVYAECAGKVLELLAAAGDGVEEGQALLRIG